MNLEEAHINSLKRKSFRFLILKKGKNELLEYRVLRGFLVDIPEIGYGLIKFYSGKGVMLEEVKGLSNFGLN